MSVTEKMESGKLKLEMPFESSHVKGLFQFDASYVFFRAGPECAEIFEDVTKASRALRMEAHTHTHIHTHTHTFSLTRKYT
jgi:hypothetical protein